MAAKQKGAEELQGLGAEAASSSSVLQQSNLEAFSHTDDKLRKSNPDEGRDSRERHDIMMEKLFEYLKLTKECINGVQTMRSPKFNNEQGGYLFEKLETTFERARLLIEECQAQPMRMFSIMDMERWAQTFKLLMVLGKQVDGFFQECGNDAWIQTAMTLANVREYVSSIGFNLELCKVALFKKGDVTQTLTMDEVGKLNANEVKIVEKKASVDAKTLLKKAIEAQQTLKAQDLELANYLVFKLNGNWASPSFVADNSNIITKLYDWVTNASGRDEQIGKGSSAKVYKVIWLGIPVAMKIFEGPNVERFLQEVKVLSQLQHPNITSMFCCNMNRRECSIVMELMDGSLHDLLRSRKGKDSEFRPFSDLEGVDLMLQVGEGVEYLHRKNVVHMDLKSENILVKKVKTLEMEVEFVLLKVVDFGLSKTKESSVSSSSEAQYNVGTSRWMAPEMIKFNAKNESVHESFRKLPKYNFEGDIYSLGMVFMEILTGELPFRSFKERAVKEMVLEGKRPPLPEYCIPRLGELIKKCWSQERNERPSIGAICSELKYLKYLLLTSGFSQGCSSHRLGGACEVEDEKDCEISVIRMMESHIGKALKIIRNVSDKADRVFVNKNQCKWLAWRFQQMGQALENDNTSSLEESAMEQILLVLMRGEMVVDGYNYRGQALANALSRAENQKSLKLIHQLIDNLKSPVFYWSDYENVTEEVVAENDLIVMIQNLDNLNLNGEFPVVMSNVKKAFVDTFRQDAAPDYDLSYLHIPMSAIVLGPPIKALPAELNKGDKHREGLTLVHEGKLNGCECAIKVFKSSDLHWNMEELQKEVTSLVKLRHPHITQLIGCAQDEDKTYVLYEKMDGDLRDLMKARIKKRRGKLPPFSRTEELSIIRQIAQGMFHLHQQGIVHGELKCTNLLVKETGDDINVRVSDFHCSRELGSNERYKFTHRPRWLPREALFEWLHPLAHDVLKQGDVYSFAMTCCEVVTGYPFDGIEVERDEAFMEMIVRGDMPKLPDHLSDDLKSLIENCWSTDPTKGPSFEEICYQLQIIVVAVPLPTSMLTRVLRLGNARTVNDEVMDKMWPPLDRERSSGGSVELEPGLEGLPQYLKIEPKNLKRYRNGKIGSGVTAQVWAATWHGCKFAVKDMKSNHVSKLRHEVDVMMKLLHPHVIRLVGFAAEGSRCAIVMELMDKSLKDFIKETMKNSAKPPFSEAEAIAIITKLANGMDFVHSRGVAHCDLKCANVLVRIAQTKNRNDILDVKLADFGGARLVKDKSRRVGHCQAPEVTLGYQDYDPRPADVWSFGMMCCEIITGKLPQPEVKPSNVREELWKLLSECWKGPNQRPTFPQICDKLAAMSPRS